MSQIHESNCIAGVAGEAIGKNLRVKLSAGKYYKAGISDKDVGVSENQAFADGDPLTIRLRTSKGTCKVVANATGVTAGGEIYTAASGKISPTFASGSYPFGMSLEASTADGDVVEALRNTHGDTSKT